MRHRKGTVAALILAIAAFAGPSAGSAAQSSTRTHKLHVDLAEWAVVPSQGLVSAGSLHLTVQNHGRLRHELDIIQTRWWGEKLALLNGRANGEDVIRPVVVAPGQRRSVHVYLEPGSYVLLDNIRGHYAAGGAVSIIAR